MRLPILFAFLLWACSHFSSGLPGAPFQFVTESMLSFYVIGQTYTIEWNNPVVGNFVYIQLQRTQVNDSDTLLLNNGACSTACGHFTNCSASATSAANGQISWTPREEDQIYRYLTIWWGAPSSDAQCELNLGDISDQFTVETQAKVNTTGNAFASTEASSSSSTSVPSTPSSNMITDTSTSSSGSGFRTSNIGEASATTANTASASSTSSTSVAAESTAATVEGSDLPQSKSASKTHLGGGAIAGIVIAAAAAILIIAVVVVLLRRRNGPADTTKHLQQPWDDEAPGGSPEFLAGVRGHDTPREINSYEVPFYANPERSRSDLSKFADEGGGNVRGPPGNASGAAAGMPSARYMDDPPAGTENARAMSRADDRAPTPYGNVIGAFGTESPEELERLAEEERILDREIAERERLREPSPQ